MNKAIVIGGPTGSGKTSAAIKLAKIFNGEIISADSVAVYRYLDIGSAKPTPEERKEVKHHLIDVVNPDVQFTGGMFQDLGKVASNSIANKNKTIIICGGTGLYINSLTKGLFPGPKANFELRSQLEKMENECPGTLFEKLNSIDPESAKRIHFNDRVRLIRAIEVYELTGDTITRHHKRHQEAPPFLNTFTIIIDPGKEILKERIAQRAKFMLKNGFIEEVKALLAKGYSPNLRSMQSVGYKQVIDFLSISSESRIKNIEQLQEEIIHAHEKYVKQQRTWFSKEQNHIAVSKDLPINEMEAFLAPF